MNFAVDYMYRLAPRGGAGLACDETGVALGATDLARVYLEAGGRRRCEVRPPGEIGRVLKAAYGPQPDAVVQRLHRGLNRTARWLESGDLCHAGVEAVMLGFPNLTPTAMAKLAEIADLEKRGEAWKDEPRLPAGQAGGGQWTTGGGGGAGTGAPSARPDRTEPSTPSAQREQPVQTLDDGAYGPAAIRQPQATLNDGVYYFGDGQGPSLQPAVTLDDGVYRPGTDQPSAVAVALPPDAEAEAEGGGIRAGRRAEAEGELPYPFTELPGEINAVQELFPRLERHPFENAPFEFPDRFGVAAYADELGAPGEAILYARLQAETKAIDPNYNDLRYAPEGGFASLREADRARLIDEVLMDRAAAYYKVLGDVSKLQIETLRLLRKTVDHYYAEALAESKAGQLEAKVSPGIAIGNYVDAFTRVTLQRLFDRLGIKYGPGQRVTINNRDYDSSDPENPTFRIPDARIGDLSFDWTLRMKRVIDPQIKGFLRADSKPKGVVIVRPSQLYANGAYYIPSPFGK